MRIECPSCHFSAEVDSVKIPPGGANTKCPRCLTFFFVAPADPVILTDDPATVICPKCGVEQDATDSCSRCGIIYEKYWAAEKRRQLVAGATEEEPVMEATPLPAAAHGSFRFGYGRGEIMAWAGEGHLATDALPRALRIAGTLP